MKRILALDVGDKTVGVAVSDELLITAQGIKTIRRSDEKKDTAEIAEVAKSFDAEKIVVGLPKHMNGDEGERCTIVREFARKLTDTIDAEIVFWDERLSTVSAERALLEADVSRKKRKKVIDKLAATVILQSYLDSLRHAVQ